MDSLKSSNVDDIEPRSERYVEGKIWAVIMFGRYFLLKSLQIAITWNNVWLSFIKC
jgi:hypothetical protein